MTGILFAEKTFEWPDTGTGLISAREFTKVHHTNTLFYPDHDLGEYLDRN